MILAYLTIEMIVQHRISMLLSIDLFVFSHSELRSNVRVNPWHFCDFILYFKKRNDWPVLTVKYI